MTAIDDAVALLGKIKGRMIDGTPLDIGIAFEISDVMKGLEEWQAAASRMVHENEGTTAVVSDDGGVAIYCWRDEEESLPRQEPPPAETRSAVAPSGTESGSAIALSGAETIEDHGRRLRCPSP